MASSSRATPLPWAAVAGLTTLRTLFNAGYRVVYPYLGVLAGAVGAPVDALAGVVALRSLWGVAGPFFAGLAEHRSRRAGLLLGAGLFVLGMAWVWFSPTLAGLAVGLMLGTAAKIAFDPAMHAYLSDRVPYARRGLVLGMAEMAWSLSFIVGVPLLGLVLARWGWRAMFGGLALVGAVGLVGLTLALPAHDRHHTPLRERVWPLVLRTPAAWRVMTLGLAASAANEVVNLVFGLWLQERFAVTLLGLGGAAALIGLSELGGEGLVVTLTDALGKRRAVAGGLLLNTLAALGLAWVDRSGTLPGALAMLFVFYLTFEFTLVSSIPLASEVMPRQRATLLGFFIASLSLGRAVGAQVASWLYAHGLLSSLAGAAGFNALALLMLLGDLGGASEAPRARQG